MRPASKRGLVLLLALAVAFSGAALSSQPPRLSPDALQSSAAEFPAADAPVLALYSRGVKAKLAAAQIANDAADPGTLRLLIETGRLDDAVAVFRAIVEKRPGDLLSAIAVLASSSHLFRDDGRSHNAALKTLVSAAHARLRDLPREEAARAARALLILQPAPEGPKGPDVLRAQFVKEYEGTEAALLTTVDLLVSTMLARRWGTPLNTDPLDDFIRERAGTTPAAYALYQKAFHLAHNSGERPGTDPVGRLERVAAIAKELESGRYPASEWVEKAPSLISGFFAYQPTYGPGSAERTIEIYEGFIRTHHTADRAPEDTPIAYVLTSKIGEVLKVNGDGVDAVERVFSRLESDPTLRSTVPYLRATFYVRSMYNYPDAPERGAFYQKAQDTFAAVHAQSRGLIQRRALASLAALRFNERDFQSAAASFRQYVAEFPAAPWSWVAALRIGQCEAALGNWKAADAAYQSALARYASIVPVLVLGNVHQAQTKEALGDFKAALSSYRLALAAWDPDYGQAYSLYKRRQPVPGEPFNASGYEPELRKHELASRVTALSRSLGLPGGSLLEQGKWLIQNGQRERALATLTRLSAQYPASAAAAEARELEGRARLDRALEIADVESTTRDEAEGVKELEALGRHRSPFVACAAQIARAAMLWKRGSSAEAEALGKRALEAWIAQYRLLKPVTEVPAIQSEVTEIRSLLFRPGGDAFLGTNWEAWRRAAHAPFVVLRRHVTVKLSNGEILDVDASSAPALANAVFFTAAQIAFFDNLLAKLGGTKRRQPKAVMEVPNQPIGGSVDLLEFLNRLFPARPGHWGGWMFETFPMITQIEFTDAARTKAAVRLTIGYEGATALLEKEQGRWVAKRLVERWIT